MENNYQEKILNKYHGFEAVKDCFAISRLQSEIGSLSLSAGFNARLRKEIEKKYDELDNILAKYPDVVEQTKE